MKLLLVVCVTAIATADWCPQGPARSDAEVDAIIKNMTSASFSSDQLKALTKGLTEGMDHNLPLRSQSMVALLQPLSFSADKATALQLMLRYAQGMNCSEGAGILKAFSFSSDRLTVLPGIAAMLYDTKSNNASILDAFDFSSDKAAALKILQSTPQQSCTFGPISVKKAIFLVDVSGSMSTSFTAPDGSMYTRLSYVQAQLSDVILDQLPKLAGRMFDVLKFSDSVGMWAPGLLPANTSNAASATQYVASWVANGGTSTLAALGAAYKPDGVEAVYLLSDGVPSDAQPSQIIAVASTLSKNGTVPCNTILFMEGGTEDRAAAETFMKSLAEATGGVFRSASNR